MKVLVVGGSGLIGGDIALHMQAQGHDITIMARKPPATPSLAALPFMQGDYINDTLTKDDLQNFDWLVFAAAADIRYMPADGSVSAEEFYTKVNDEAVPRFFKVAKSAGIKRAVYISTFYPQVAPQQIGVCPYVTSRHNTDEAVMALSDENFTIYSLRAPFVLGNITGMHIPHIGALVAYAKGEMPDLPVFAPEGGTNHISSHSIAQATLAAFEKGGKSTTFLLGDHNYSWKEYFELWFKAAGNPKDLEVRADDHPIVPNVIMFAGVGATISYEAEGAELLGYDRDQLPTLIKEVVASYSN